MTDLQDFLQRLVTVFGVAGIPYMVTGSVASTFHGSPRATQDIDVVVEISSEGLRNLLAEFNDDTYYVSREAASDALRLGTLFNVIDMATGWKADLIVRKNRAFSEVEFSRRERAVVLGVPVWVATAEDAIISKLEWSALAGGSERQLRDVAGVLGLKGDDLDRAYIENWCEELGLREVWDQLNRQDDPNGGGLHG